MSNLLTDIKKELAKKISSWVGLSPLSADASEEQKKIYQQKLIQRATHRVMWMAIFLMPILLITLWLGTLLGSGKKQDHRKHKHKATTSNERKVKFWTCSMHPQIKLPNNDAKCPICFMDLTPVYSGGGNEVGASEMSLTPSALKLAKIKAQPVLYRKVTHTLRIVGKVDYDETKVTNINLWTPGKSKLDRMFIDFTGANVKKGAPLVEVYSPDLIAAQGEYLSAYDSYQKLAADAHVQGLVDNLQASKRKLIDLGMTKQQVSALENKKQPQQTTVIYSPVSGTVVGKLVNEGEWHGRGMSLYRIADLSTVWIKLDAYETDIGWIRHGQQVEFEAEAYPGKVFRGKIAFIDPFLNATTRTIRVRVNVDNPDGELKPGMFVRANIKVRIAEKGQVITHQYTKKPIKIRSRVLTIPHTAPLLTGKRAIVYLQKEKKKYDSSSGEMKVVQRLYYAVEVKLGPRTGDYYVVLSGLEEGQMVVSHGVFKIDSALQIMAKPSMMSPPHQKSTSEKTPSSQENSSEKTIAISGKYWNANALHHQPLKEFIAAYIHIGNIMAQDQVKGIHKYKKTMVKALAKINAQTMTSDSQLSQKIKSQLSTLRQVLMEMHGEDITQLRRDYFDISNTLIAYIKDFGHLYSSDLYVVYCSMYRYDLGGHWIQDNKRVNNPYFGSEMLRCGDVEVVIPAITKPNREENSNE